MTTSTQVVTQPGGFWEDPNSAPGYVKAGFLGFQGTGKSLTAALLAVAIRAHFKLTGPISMYDTESGSAYLKDLLKDLTGVAPLIKRARSFDDLMAWLRESMAAKASVGIADSITHPWREMCDAYLQQVNEARKAKNWNLKKSLEFEDWNVLKPRWSRWSDSYLNSPMHLIVCGRAGYEYDMQKNEESGKNELLKTGIKMKTEGEFGYEPSLLVQLVIDRAVKKNRQIGIRRAVVLKDRFMDLDGKEFEFPSTADPKVALVAVTKAFMPHLKRHTSGQHATVDTTARTEFNVDADGTDGWSLEKRQRTILAEEIQGELVQAYPGQTQADKTAKGKMLRDAFGTYSWTAVENLPSEVLRKGLRFIKDAIATARGGVAPPATTATDTPADSPAHEPGAAEAAAAFGGGDVDECPRCGTVHPPSQKCPEPSKRRSRAKKDDAEQPTPPTE